MSSGSSFSAFWGTSFGPDPNAAIVHSANVAMEAERREIVKGANRRKKTQRLHAAMQAHANGDIQTASRLISNALHSRDLNLAVRREMEQVLLDYKSSASSELAMVQEEIKGIVEQSTGGELNAAAAVGGEVERDPRTDPLLEAMGELQAMSRRYKHVPFAGDAIKEALEHAKTRDEGVAAILYEPTAANLILRARAMEAEDQRCCAFLCYEEAAKLLPCASARRAVERVAALSTDDELAKERTHCRNIRRCQANFDKAMEFAGKQGKSARETAKKMLRKVVDSAPKSSEVRAAAQKELMALTNG